MAGSKILVLGGTGPAGICLLRELVHRSIPTVAYARSPAKIPAELTSSRHLEVIAGEMDDEEALSTAVAKSNIIISLLGPNTMKLKSYTLFPDFYRLLFKLMKEHHVTRIYAMGTISIPQPADRFSILRYIVVWLVYLIARSAYRNILGVAKVFEEEGQGLDWTIFRIAGIPGESDEESWKKDREQDAVAGAVADGKWGMTVKRSALARWLVDAAEGDGKEWVRKMPTISGVSGGKKSV
jgi:putative NADH-flavin reductase